MMKEIIFLTFHMTTVITPEQIQQAELQKQTPTLPENPKTSVVFKEGVPPQVTALDTASSPVRTKLETLRGLQALSPTEARTREMIDLERQRGRIARFALLQKSATPEQKEILKDKDVIEKLRASDILLLKKKGVDLANLLLVPVGVDPTKSTNRDFIEKGEHKNFIVNFGENKNGKNDIDNIVGAGDILPLVVSQVKIVSIKYPNGIIADRRSSPRPGYYNDTCKPPYIAIHDGDRIEILKIGAVDEKALKEATESEDKWLRDRRIEDMIDNGGKALSELPEDKKLEAEAQEEIKQRKEIRESIGTMRQGRFFGTTDKPISETVKALKDLNVTETNNLLKKVFGEGPGTNLLIAIDNESTFAIKRMIALAYHEGGLHFGRQNPDPASGFNIGTFQIGGTGSTKESSLNKYESCLQA